MIQISATIPCHLQCVCDNYRAKSDKTWTRPDNPFVCTILTCSIFSHDNIPPHHHVVVFAFTGKEVVSRIIKVE